MARTTLHPPLGGERFEIRAVEASRPLGWLRQGLDDLRRAPALALAYGLAFAAVGYVLLLTLRGIPHLVPALLCGFMLVAPLLAVGLYDASRRLERGERPTLAQALACWRGRGEQMALFGLILALVLIAWERLSAILFALFFPDGLPTLENFAGQVLLSGGHPQFLLAYLATGFVLAAFVFAISVVSVPLLLDRDADAVSAVLASLDAVARNPAAMVVWAALIAAITALGLAAFLVGLAVALPLLGHASWHAYRDLMQ